MSADSQEPLTHWTYTERYNQLRRQLSAYHRLMKRAEDPAYTPLTDNGTLLVTREITRVNLELDALNHRWIAQQKANRKAS